MPDAGTQSLGVCVRDPWPFEVAELMAKVLWLPQWLVSQVNRVTMDIGPKATHSATGVVLMMAAACRENGASRCSVIVNGVMLNRVGREADGFPG